MDREEQRRASLANWEVMAPGWERRREERERGAGLVTEWLVRELAPKTGDTVLELAAGQGDVGFQASPLLGESGRLIASDFSPAMLETARRRCAEFGLENVEFLEVDAEDIELEDDSIDGVLCRFGYMLMPDPPAALAETRRVLRPGGRLALAVFSTAERNPWVSLAGRILTERGYMPPPEPGTPGMFVLADEERLRAFLEDAGFTSARMEDVLTHQQFPSVDEYVRRSSEMGGMFSRAWAAAPEDEHKTLKVEFAEAFEPFKVDGGYALPGVALCVVAS